MLLADPLSRICAPSSGFYDPSLPSKFQALAKYLPNSIKLMKTIRLYAYQMRKPSGCLAMYKHGELPLTQLVRVGWPLLLLMEAPSPLIFSKFDPGGQSLCP
jgi:hypothetical protein